MVKLPLVQVDCGRVRMVLISITERIGCGEINGEMGLMGILRATSAKHSI